MSHPMQVSFNRNGDLWPDLKQRKVLSVDELSRVSFAVTPSGSGACPGPLALAIRIDASETHTLLVETTVQAFLQVAQSLAAAYGNGR